MAFGLRTERALHLRNLRSGFKCRTRGWLIGKELGPGKGWGSYEFTECMQYELVGSRSLLCF